MKYVMLGVNALASFVSFVNFSRVANGMEVKPSQVAFAFIALSIFFALNAFTAWERIKKEESK